MKTKEAETFAMKVHSGQKQTSGKPYVEHPLKVAFILKNWNQDEDVVCAGLLHDVVEDSGISLSELKNKFGKRTAFLVDGMSWVLNKKTHKKDWEATYRKFVSYSKKDSSLVLIKLADMISNIPNVRLNFTKQNEWFIKKSYPVNMGFYVPFMKMVGLSSKVKPIEIAFSKYIKKRVKSRVLEFISKEDLEKIKQKISQK